MMLLRYISQIGKYFLMLKEVFNKPTKWSVMRGLILKEIDDLIIGSLGIVAFISFFVGGVVSIQTALNLNNPLIPREIIGFATRESIILEFAPTFISIVMAGKMGSFITSSIGTMRVTEQIDALEVMGINSYQYLAVPRILGATLSLPLLSGIFLLIGYGGAWLIGTQVIQIDDAIFSSKISDFMDLGMVAEGLIKAAVFGYLIGIIGTFHGFSVTGGAEGVGKGTNLAVVWGMITVLVVDFFLTSFLTKIL